jgi:hypothetical protein
MEMTTGLIQWESDYERATQRARAEKKEMLVYFHKHN